MDVIEELPILPNCVSPTPEVRFGVRAVKPPREGERDEPVVYLAVMSKEDDYEIHLGLGDTVEVRGQTWRISDIHVAPWPDWRVTLQRIA